MRTTTGAARALRSLLLIAALAVIGESGLSCNGTDATGPSGPSGASGPNTPAPVLTTLNVSLSSTSIQVGQTATASATGVDQNGAAFALGVVTWTTESASIATVSSAGIITGVAPGQTVVIASSGGKQAQQTITVVAVPVASVVISGSLGPLVAGSTRQLTATTLDSNGGTLNGRAVTWTSSNQATATVSGAGLVTAVAPGTVTITATSEGKSGVATITVTSVPAVPVASVRVNPPSALLKVGDTQQLSAEALDANGSPLAGREIVWTSANQAVASVNSSGLVTAVAQGTAMITATSEGKSASSAITVAAIVVPVASVTVSPGSLSLIVGGTQQLFVSVLDANGGTLPGRAVVWSSSNASVASVDPTGFVTAAGEGVATITATSEGKSGTSVITVTRVPVGSITVSPSSPTITIGTTVQLNATVRDANGVVVGDRSVTWTSSDVTKATVTAAGSVTATGIGAATITASAEGKSGDAVVTVIAVPVASVSVTPPSASLTAGDTQQLSATTLDANGAVLAGRAVTWVSSDPAKATVSPSGLVTAVAAGTATITATSEGKSGSSAITVSPKPNANILTGIKNAFTFLDTCPTSDAAYNTIRSDFELRSDGVLVTAPIACTSPYPTSSLTEELVILQTLRMAYYMSQGTQGRLPWTAQALYEWMKSQIAGVNIHTGSGNAACCEFINGKRYMILWRRTGAALDIYRTWNYVSAYMALLAHEVRHVAGPGHVTGCAAFPLPTDPLGCDATYDLNNLGSYGVQYWLFSSWATGYMSVGIGCAPGFAAQDYATFAASAANLYVSPSRFVTNTPPSVTATIPYGGACVP